jgi:hypothetical protein
MVEVFIELHRTPVGGPRALDRRGHRGRSFFAYSVLIPTIVLEIDNSPGLGTDERGEVGSGHDFGLLKFTIPAGSGVGQPGEQPHTTKRNAGAKARGRLSDETSAGGFEDAEDFVENGLAVSNYKEEARDDDGIDRVGRVEKGVNIALSEGAVSEAAAGGAGFCSSDEASGEVDAGGVDLRVFL